VGSGGVHDARSGGSVDACRITAGIVQIVIDVRVDGDEISGYASDGVAERKPFLGWLGLIGVLDGLLVVPSSPDAPPQVWSTQPPPPDPGDQR
jgi:hypothetical protein